MTKASVIFLFAITLFTIIGGCSQKASSDEIEQMCHKLAQLRNKIKDKAQIKQCIAEAKKESLSKRQAQCRISAVNLQEYWVRCRTGKAKTAN